MPRRKSSSSGGNKKDEAKQKGAHDQGEIPSVPESQDSEGACGQSPSPSEDKVQTEQSQYTDGREEPDGSGSSRITGGHALSKKEKKERKEAKKREKDKQVREKKEAERQEKERKEREKQKEKERKKMERQKTRNASQSKQRNSSSQDAQPAVFPNESHLPRDHRNPSEGSQGSQALAGIEDATLEEGTKQTSSEAQGDSMQTATVDEPPVFVEPESGQMTASKDEKDKRIAELEERSKRLAEELKETKSSRIQKLETEIELLRAKETEFNTQHQEHMNDLRAALQRKHDEIEKLTHDHASEMKIMQDDHSKRMSQLHQERKQIESEKDEEAKRLKQRLQEKDKVNQEFEEKIKLLRSKSVLLEEKLKEKEGDEEELCPLPPNHHLEEIKKQKEELENKHALKLNRLEAAFKEKEKQEEKCREEADRLRQELEVAKEKHANDVEQLHQLKQKDEQAANTLRQELKDTSEKHADEVRRLQTALKDKDEQEVTKLRLELEELTEKNAKKVQQLKTELEEKETQYTKAIADVKAEYEDKHKAEERQKEAEVERKVKRQEAVSSGVLREKKNEIEKLKKECEDKDNAIVGLTEKLNKMKEEYEQKELETEKQVEAMKSEIEKLQHEQRKQHVAEASKKQKEHDQLLEIKTKEIESLRNKLQVSKEAPETVQRLQEQLQEKDCELNTVVTEIKTLRNHYETLTAEHEHLQHLHGQLKVELKMKRELDECNEYSSSSDPSNTTVIEPLNQHSSDTRTTEEERDFQSASESSFTERDNLTDAEKAELQQQLAESQGEISKRDKKIAEMDRRIEDLEHQLLQVEQAKQEDFSEEPEDPVEGASDTKGRVISYSKFSKLRQSYGELMEKLTKQQEEHECMRKELMEKLTKQQEKYKRTRKELMEKLEERQKQLEGERQMPQTHHSPSRKDHEPVKDMDHETALQEVGCLRRVIDEKEMQVSSLKTQLQSFDKTAAERQEFEKKYSAAKAEIEQLKESNEELVKKVNELEEHEVSQGELYAQKQNGEREEIHKLEKTVLELRHEIQHLNGQLRGYDGMHKEVEHLKENASDMLKKFRSLLGTSEEDSSVDFKELTRKLNELMNELEAQKDQAQIYKADFEAERKAREDAAGKKVEEIAAIQNSYSEAVAERDDVQRQLAKVLEDHERESEESKRLLQETMDNAAKNIQDLKEAHEEEMNAHVEDTERIVAHNQQEMKTEVAKLNECITHLEEERAQVSRERDQLKENRDEVKRERDEVKRESDDLKKQIQELCEQNEELEGQRKAKEKEAELNAAERNELENEVRQLRSVTSSLQTEVAEVKQQLTIALADKEALSDESLAKTQQVKQYKKQVDNFRIQLAKSNAKLEQYQARLHQCESDLAYCQSDLRIREEDEESKVAFVVAQHESEMSNLNSELGRLRREKADVEKQLRQLQKGVIPPETANLVDNLEREKIEWEHKYTHLRDRYDGIFQQKDQLAAALKKHNIPIPVLQMPGAMIPHSPHTPHVQRQNLMYEESCDRADKSITSPASIRQLVNQPFDFNPQQRLVVLDGSSVPHQGMVHQQQPYWQESVYGMSIKQKPAARRQGDNQIEENRCLSSEPQNKSEHREGRTTRLEREVKELRLNVQMVVAKQRDEEQVKDKEPAVAALISQSDDSGENSVEYSTLIELTSELRLAISSELISLTGSLLAVRFISLDNEIELRNPAHSERERSARLVGLIQNKVRQNPRHYHTFISILQGNQDQYRDILQRLEHTYQKHKHNDGFTSA